ncbi:hypothetical protein JOM56_007484 [Amanita muscaria]
MPTTAISFPNELVEAFIDTTWSLPLSAEERISLMTTLPLVNTSWRDAYSHVSSKDIHIPCAAFGHHLLHTILPDVRNIELCRTRCRSITFTVDHPATPVVGGDSDDGHGHLSSSIDAIEDIFYAIEYPRFPNLRRIAIHYHNANFDDIFKNTRLDGLPLQVTSLEVAHIFSPNVPPFLVLAMRHKHHAQLGIPWRMHHVKRLSLGGVGSDYVADMIAACPNLRELELNLAPHTDIFVSLPESVESVILHAPEGANLSAHNLLPSGTLVMQPPQVDDNRWLYLQASTCYSLICMRKTDDMFIIALTYPSQMS